MTQTPFFKVLPGERFLYQNNECVKLRQESAVSSAFSLGEIKVNVVTLDKGELIFVKDDADVILFTRSY